MDSEVPKFDGKKKDAKRYKTSGSSSFNTESEDASINLNVAVGDDEEDEVQELARPLGRDKAKGLKKKGAGSSGSSSSMNCETLARLMVSELALHNECSMAMKKKECLAFLEIRRREVEIRERELAMQDYKQRQKDIMFYMQPYNHLTGDALKLMEEIRAGINEKRNLPY
ncbi:zinc finger BED domain-containing protein RICESLEEPER 2-like protein [Tanacetum coccineum]